jgi:putative tryptophan/tyrosine transport system substrate-binding protein
MRRRDLIKGIAGSAAAWPLAARAQQAERKRRIAVLLGWSETPNNRSSIDAFVQELRRLGWEDGRSPLLGVKRTYSRKGSLLNMSRTAATA